MACHQELEQIKGEKICDRLCENPPCSRILYIFTKQLLSPDSATEF